MKENVEMIYFHIKCKGVQDFEKCTTMIFFLFCFVFWKVPSWYKNVNCQIVALISMKPFLMFMRNNLSFMQPLFQQKCVFIKIAAFFISGTRHIFPKLLAVSESLTKVKVRSHRTLNFVHLSSYLQTKTFAWKQDCAISSKRYNICQNHFRKTF